ncbi:sigma-70 family RNA polymerase sigma factor [Polaromonas sp. A23]|uniref:sigma-70 family RNA polymerase sigma factor n=1 Tax=Polaromonas sp. A23 TaxID=1944133 RepID=UPI0009859B96|nr:sigma-70 family RNA polymerase sigma factor [Polaromonas sp. A23]OOG39812.1 RNA polymerase subunit sigma-70 [Polaromonas sp. A23]
MHPAKLPDPPIPDPDFPQLMAQLRARLHRYCARMTGSMLDGEDVVQETLIKANGSYDAQAVQNVEAWLFRIAHNAAMDFLRRRSREQAMFADEDVDAIADTQAEPADRRHVATAALRTFMRLAPAQRSTVILADVLGYALEEAAGVMGTTVPAVKAALHRGRAHLRELASQPDDAAPPPSLSPQDQALLAAYAERFNARDFDGLREMLGQDVKLDLVARRKPMQARGGEYFTNYAAKTYGLRMTPINVEGRPGLWVDTEADEGAGAPGYVVVLAFAQGKVTGIRDFRYARWVCAAIGTDPGKFE